MRQRTVNFLYLLLWCLLLCTSCTSPMAGDSPEALESRIFYAEEILNACAPDGCALSTLITMQYGWCANPDIPKINKRLEAVRKMLIDYLYENPWFENIEEFNRILLEDLYYCRNSENKRLVSGENIIFCESKLSKKSDKKYSKMGLEYLGIENGLYKYKITWK